jgi:predicted ATPase
MSYLASFGIKTERTNPFPFNISAVKFAKHVALPTPVTFIIGDNGTGKSTLLESLAFRLQLPHVDGSSYKKSGFEGAKALVPYLELKWNIERTVGFFFRAEDFGDLINSIDREDSRIHETLSDLVGEVPDEVIKQMKESANFQLHHMRKNYGQDLQTFSHGEAYLKIMQDKM